MSRERRTEDPPGLLVAPDAATGTAVLLLAGSSGRIDEGRARVLAGAGVTVWAIRWFGGPGQQPAPYDVPLELFTGALDRLAREHERLVVVGTSFGAEAALLTASYDDRVAACVAFAPTPVVWTGYDGDRTTSRWTRAGVPLSPVPFLAGWEPDDHPPSYRELYATSLAAATVCGRPPRRAPGRSRWSAGRPCSGAGRRRPTPSWGGRPGRSCAGCSPGDPPLSGTLHSPSRAAEPGWHAVAARAASGLSVAAFRGPGGEVGVLVHNGTGQDRTVRVRTGATTTRGYVVRAGELGTVRLGG